MILALLTVGVAAAWYPAVDTYLAYLSVRGILTVAKVDHRHVAASLGAPLDRGEFPAELDVYTWSGARRGRVQYGIDVDAQNEMEKVLGQYRPDYAAMVALDAATGRVLSLISYSRSPHKLGNLTTKAWFPAASVFKIVTATAAIESKQMTPDSIISFTGSNHTLYKRNLMQVEPRRWARHMTLREAFAKSVNTVFGKLGAFILSPADLDAYAHRFQFNQSISADFPVQRGRFDGAEQDDAFGLAELASGFNRTSLMSPVQGAMIAAAVVNDGVIMAPWLVESLHSTDGGQRFYEAEPRKISVAMSAETAAQMRSLMDETVRRGTSRKAFRTFLRRREAAELEIGGKTGSLTGTLLKGKVDWFVGYGRKGDSRIAVSVLTVNERVWRVKSSYLARTYIERFYQEPEEEPEE